jgi:predicted ester cyclase
MLAEQLKSRTREGFERMFERGDLDYVDETVAPDAVDHQEPEGTDFAAHLKSVITTLRAAFPDLHFEVHEVLCEGDVVACRSTMTGTHQGPLRIGPLAGVPVAGVRVEVPHMALLPLRRPGPPDRPMARVEHTPARSATWRARPGPAGRHAGVAAAGSTRRRRLRDCGRVPGPDPACGAPPGLPGTPPVPKLGPGSRG